jgi:hypothetical protein
MTSFGSTSLGMEKVTQSSPCTREEGTQGEQKYGPTILNLDNGGVVNLAPRPLYSSEKTHWSPLNRRLVGLQSRRGRFGK